uniref:Uncharacterized protein n=1 Tax=Anguilla anguilla TaxID=7936 RepID=A0A0E9WG57_ANGAN
MGTEHLSNWQSICKCLYYQTKVYDIVHSSGAFFKTK